MTAPGCLRAWGVPVAYAALLVLASLLPSRPDRAGSWDAALPPDLQNAAHVPAYGLMVVLVLVAWSGSRNVNRVVVVIIGTACAALGALLECAQAVVPGRTGSLTDMLLNAAGVLAGAIVYLALAARSVRPSAADDEQSAG